MAGVEAGNADDEEEMDVGVVLGQEQPCTSETCDDVGLLDENTDAENASFDDHADDMDVAWGHEQRIDDAAWNFARLDAVGDTSSDDGPGTPVCWSSEDR